MPITQERYGWHPSLPDQRDRTIGTLLAGVPQATLPVSVDLTKNMPAVRNQGQLGSCTGFASTGAYYATSKGNGRYPVNESALFAYYNARWYEGTVDYDSGATIRDVIKGLAKFGAASDTAWPYVPSKYAVKAPASVYNTATRHQVLEYYAVGQTELELKRALATGYPVVVGFTVYDSFESSTVARTGNVPLPGANEAVLGGHAVVLCGYDSTNPYMWLCQNSWGLGWGNRGYFRMDSGYLTNRRLAGDFWTMRVTEG
jgi:C1A family cysteine protease